MTLSDIKDLTAALQSIVIAIATICAGAWAWYTYSSGRALENKRREMDKAIEERRHTLAKIERELEARSSITIKLKATPLRQTEALFLRVNVTLRNVGNSAETIDWSKATLTAHRLEHQGEEFSFQGVTDTSVPLLTSLVRLEVGYSTTYIFLLALPTPGIYFVHLSVPASPVEAGKAVGDLKSAGHSHAVEPSDVQWTAQTIVEVPDKPANAAH